MRTYRTFDEMENDMYFRGCRWNFQSSRIIFFDYAFQLEEVSAEKSRGGFGLWE